MSHLLNSDWIIDVLNGQPGATQTLIALAPQGFGLVTRNLRDFQHVPGLTLYTP